MKKLILGTAAAAMIATSGLAAEFTLKFSHVVNANTPKGQAADFFGERLEELSKGRIDVQVYPSAQLYNDDTVLKALRLDTVQMGAPSFSKFGKIIPQLALFDLPFIFRDTEHLHKVQEGEVGQKLKDLAEKKGFIALDYWDAGFKHFTSNTRPIINPEDVKGQKIRIMSSKVLEEQIKVVEGNPQVTPFSEVYSALQQGVVDGAENPISNLYNSKFYEVQKYMTVSEHGYLGYLVVMSKKFWNKLPQDLKDNVLQAMKEATAKERALTQELDAKQLQDLRDYAKKTGKLEIYTLTPEQKDAWRKTVETIYPKFYDEDVVGEDLIKATINTK